MLTTKQKVWAVVAVVVLATGGFFAFATRDRDCDQAVAAVKEKVGEFQQKEGEIGRCDGVCVDWSAMGCTVSDDFNTWIVTPFGDIMGPDEAEAPSADWQTITIGGVVTFEVPAACHIDPGAGNAYLVCPTEENPTPTPEIHFSSDGQTVNVRRWENLESPYWNHMVASMKVVQPMTRDITINIQK